MLKTNLAEFRAGFNKWLKQQEAAAVQVYRGLAATCFAYVVEETPEYTGESVANWTLRVGSPELKTTSGIKMGRAVRRQGGRVDPVWNKPGTSLLPMIAEGSGGNPKALRIAREALRRGFREITSLDQTVWLANATSFDHGNFAVGALEEPPAGWLREVNQPGHMMKRAVSYMGSRFRRIDYSNIRSLMVMPA